MPSGPILVEVVQKREDFKITVSDARGILSFIITSADGLLPALVQALQDAEKRGENTRLVAPDWIKAELVKLGRRT